MKPAIYVIAIYFDYDKLAPSGFYKFCYDGRVGYGFRVLWFGIYVERKVYEWEGL